MLSTSLDTYIKTLRFKRKNCLSTLENPIKDHLNENKKLSLRFLTIRRTKRCVRGSEPYSYLSAQLKKLFKNTLTPEHKGLNVSTIPLSGDKETLGVINLRNKRKDLLCSFIELNESYKKRYTYKITPQIKKCLVNVCFNLINRFQRIIKKHG